MTTIAQPGSYERKESSTPSRHAALVAAVQSLRPGRGGRFPIESFLLTVGAFLLPIGVVTILLGWWGASHTGHVYEQNAYLISGGLLGLGLIFIGGFLYFGYWMTRGSMLHRRDCPVVAGKANLRAVDTGTPGYQACGVCRPLDEA